MNRMFYAVLFVCSTLLIGCGDASTSEKKAAPISSAPVEMKAIEMAPVAIDEATETIVAAAAGELSDYARVRPVKRYAHVSGRRHFQKQIYP